MSTELVIYGVCGLILWLLYEIGCMLVVWGVLRGCWEDYAANYGDERDVERLAEHVHKLIADKGPWSVEPPPPCPHSPIHRGPICGPGGS